MSNPLRAVKTWPHLLGLCPLLVIDLRIVDAAIFGAALLITLLFSHLAMALLQRLLAEWQRLAATAMLAALSIGIIDLLLQAVCYSHARILQYYLPLLVIAPLLFYKTEAMNTRSLSRVFIDALLCASAFGCALVVTSLLRAPLPDEIAIPLGLICGGLLLALANKAAPPRLPMPPLAEPRTRARVTGPVR